MFSPLFRISNLTLQTLFVFLVFLTISHKQSEVTNPVRFPCITQAVRMRHLSTKRCLGAQNAIHVEEMLPKRSECDTCRQNAASVLKMRHLSTKCCLVAQNAIHVEEIQPKRSECHTYHQNATWTLRMRYMSKKCYLSAQNAAPVEKTEPRCSSREIAENEQGL